MNVRNNIVGHWDEVGDLVAEYACDAFGNTMSSSGTMADIFPHRFSTKHYDAETDLYYYGYRYYSPSLGRWISRDPIDEKGGMNLYSFVFNDCMALSDSLGQAISGTIINKADGGFVISITIPIQVIDCCPKLPRLSDSQIQASINRFGR